MSDTAACDHSFSTASASARRPMPRATVTSAAIRSAMWPGRWAGSTLPSARGDGARLHRAARRRALGRRPDRRLGADGARVGREGQHDGTLGDRRRASRASRSRPTRTDFPRRSWRSSPLGRAAGDRQRGRQRHRRHRPSSAPEHQRTGSWILYTSADSVFQVAAHEAVDSARRAVPRPARSARAMLVPPNDVSRVIARPFVGAARGVRAHRRTGAIFRSPPPERNAARCARARGIPRAGVGKVDDLFAGRGITSQHTASNAEGIAGIRAWFASAPGGLLFANLVDFDQLFGHRNDVPGFYRALREFDAALPALVDALREDDLLFITADHGNDPTTPSTDHARECVPLLAFGRRVRPVALGTRRTFSRPRRDGRRLARRLLPRPRHVVRCRRCARSA